MPYIPEAERQRFDQALAALPSIVTAGELNYVLTAICHEHLSIQPRVGYSELAEVIKALECAKLEFYRCVMAGYEDIKRAENGHISSFDRKRVPHE